MAFSQSVTGKIRGDGKSMSTESKDGISYAKAISLDALDRGDLSLVDQDDEELAVDTSSEATAEAGLTTVTGGSTSTGGVTSSGGFTSSGGVTSAGVTSDTGVTSAGSPAGTGAPGAHRPGTEISFETDESGVAR
jgi:hypothetical protein